MPRPWLSLVPLPLVVAALAAPVPPADPRDNEWPMYGGSPGRNMANFRDTDLLGTIDPEKGLPLKWKADLGSRSYSQPVVSIHEIMSEWNVAIAIK